MNEVAISNDTVTLTLASPVHPGEGMVRVSYSPFNVDPANRLQDAIGNPEPNLRRWDVTNTREAPGVSAVAFTNPPSGPYSTPGSHIEVTLTFNESVTVSGAPRIELSPAFGPNDETRYAGYVSGSPGATLVFRYALVEGDYSDGDNVSVAASALDADGADGSAAIRTTDDQENVSAEHAAADSGKLVSAVRPRITQAWSLPVPTIDADLDGDNDTYDEGKTFSVKVSFSNEIVVANPGTGGVNAQVVVDIGGAEHTLNYKEDTKDSVTFSGSHTVASGDIDDDGITIVRDGSGKLVRLSGSATIKRKNTVTDADLTADADLIIRAKEDGVPARVRGDNEAPTGSDFTTVAATNVDLVFARTDFAINDTDGDPLKEIQVVTLPDAADGALKFDGTAIPSGDLPKTVTHLDLDDGKLVFAPAQDYVGDASFTFKVVDSFEAAAASANTATISVVPLHVTEVKIVSTPSRDADGDGAAETYLGDNKVRVRLTFNEAVDVDTAGGRPRLTIKMDPSYGEKWAGYQGGSGTAQLTFVHTVVWPNLSPKGIAVLENTLELNGGTIKSTANQADAALVHGGLDHDPQHKVHTDICKRTPQVRQALVEAFGKPCGKIDGGDLSGLRLLDLGEKGITSLKPGDFHGMYNLDSLWLDGNRLTKLPKGMFRDLWLIDTLSLDRNPLGTLPANAFGVTPRLKWLDLRQTKLTAIHVDAFKGLTGLYSIDLAQNSLTTLPAGMFEDQSELSSLGLGRNKINSLPDGVFDQLTGLRSLALCFNRLGSLPDGVFDQLTNLEILLLQVNALRDLDAGLFSNLTKLEELNLSQNDIRTLPEDTFSGLNKLKWLYLDHNDLTSLPGDAFDDLAALKHLSLHYNDLTTLPDNIFSSLDAPLKIVLRNNWGSPFDLEKLGVQEGVVVDQQRGR